MTRRTSLSSVLNKDAVVVHMIRLGERSAALEFLLCASPH